MIANYIVGSTINDLLLVKSSEVKLTKKKSKYLVLHLTDGTDTITANRWDYQRDDAIPPNTVVMFTAQVSEYLGNKQLNVSVLNLAPVQDISEFIPRGPVDVQDYLEQAQELINEVQQPELNAILNDAFFTNIELWKSVPAANSIHHAFLAGTLMHCVDVAIKAKAIADAEEHASTDLVIAGALLHDFGKLWCYEMDGAVIKYTFEGEMLDHTVLGILKLEKYRTEENDKILYLLQHCIAAHHGILEYGASTTPKCMEAHIISIADGLDAKFETYKEEVRKVKPDAEWTAKIYSMENKAHMTPTFISDTLYGGDPF